MPIVPFERPQDIRHDSCTIPLAELREQFSPGYGNDFYEITPGQLEALQAGDILCLDAQNEYGIYVRLQLAQSQEGHS